MNKAILKYSLACLGAGLSVWYFSAEYYYDINPRKLVEEMAEYGVFESILYDAKKRSMPLGLVSRPLTYTGLAGLLVSLAIPRKKKKDKVSKEEVEQKPPEPENKN